MASDQGHRARSPSYSETSDETVLTPDASTIGPDEGIESVPSDNMQARVEDEDEDDSQAFKVEEYVEEACKLRDHDSEGNSLIEELSKQFAKTVFERVMEGVAEKKASAKSPADGEDSGIRGSQNENNKTTRKSCSAEDDKASAGTPTGNANLLLEMLKLNKKRKENDTAMEKEKEDFDKYKQEEAKALQGILDDEDDDWSTELFNLFRTATALGGSHPFSAASISLLKTTVQWMKVEVKRRDIKIGDLEFKLKIPELSTDSALHSFAVMGPLMDKNFEGLADRIKALENDKKRASTKTAAEDESGDLL